MSTLIFFTCGKYIDSNILFRCAIMDTLSIIWRNLFSLLFLQPPGVDLTPDDPRWIGAWWLGYFFGGLLLLCTSIALLGYPREMPGAREQRLAAIREGLLPPRDEHIQGRLKDILPATKAILTNKVFMFNTCAFCCTTLIATGLGPFVSKFIQSQFGKSSSTAGECRIQTNPRTILKD